MNTRALLTALALIGCASCSDESDRGRKEFESAVAEAEAKGIQFGLEAMERTWRVDPEMDAAPHLDEVFQMQEDYELYAPGGKEANPVQIALKLREDTRLLQKLQTALNKPRASSPVVLNELFKTFAPYKALAKLLVISAEGEVRLKNWKTAKERLLAASKIATFVSQKPSAFSALVDYAIQSIVMGRCVALLRISNGAPEVVKVVRAVADSLPGEFDLRNAWPYEVQVAHYAATHRKQNKNASNTLPQELVAQSRETQEESEAVMAVAAVAIRSGALQTEAVREPGFPHQYDALVVAADEFASTQGESSAFDSKVCRSLRTATEKALAAKSILKILASTYEARRQSGKWPATCPMPQLLEDSRGFSIRYAALPQGVTVYYFGPDGNDDGGVPLKGTFIQGRSSDDYGIGVPSVATSERSGR